MGLRKLSTFFRGAGTVALFLFAAGLAPVAGQGSAGEREEAGRSYVLRSMDVIEIQVFGEEELSRVQRIDGAGQIRMGLIGTMEIAGRTLREAENALERAYVEQRYLRDPQVSLSVQEYAPLFVSVLGEVQSPGRVELEAEAEGMRLVDAISAVGGFTGIAKGNAVRITRIGEDGEESTSTVDAAALINGDPSGVPPRFRKLKAGDVVYVPETLF